MLNKNCEVCGQEFTPERGDSIYCSKVCKQRAYRQRKKKEALIEEEIKDDTFIKVEEERIEKEYEELELKTDEDQTKENEITDPPPSEIKNPPIPKIEKKSSYDLPPETKPSLPAKKQPHRILPDSDYTQSEMQRYPDRYYTEMGHLTTEGRFNIHEIDSKSLLNKPEKWTDFEWLECEIESFGKRINIYVGLENDIRIARTDSGKKLPEKFSSIEYPELEEEQRYPNYFYTEDGYLSLSGYLGIHELDLKALSKKPVKENDFGWIEEHHIMSGNFINVYEGLENEILKAREDSGKDLPEKFTIAQYPELEVQRYPNHFYLYRGQSLSLDGFLGIHELDLKSLTKKPKNICDFDWLEKDTFIDGKRVDIYEGLRSKAKPETPNVEQKAGIERAKLSGLTAHEVSAITEFEQNLKSWLQSFIEMPNKEQGESIEKLSRIVKEIRTFEKSDIFQLVPSQHPHRNYFIDFSGQMWNFLRQCRNNKSQRILVTMTDERMKSLKRVLNELV